MLRKRRVQNEDAIYYVMSRACRNGDIFLGHTQESSGEKRP
jgi:hypothetical protein